MCLQFVRHHNWYKGNTISIIIIIVISVIIIVIIIIIIIITIGPVKLLLPMAFGIHMIIPPYFGMHERRKMLSWIRFTKISKKSSRMH